MAEDKREKDAGAQSEQLTWAAFVREMLYRDRLGFWLVFAVLLSAYMALKLVGLPWKAYALAVAAGSLCVLALLVLVPAAWRAIMVFLRWSVGFPLLRLHYNYDSIDPAALVMATWMKLEGTFPRSQEASGVRMARLRLTSTLPASLRRGQRRTQSPDTWRCPPFALPRGVPRSRSLWSLTLPERR